MMYGKRLMDAFYAESRAHLDRDEVEQALVMSAMENAVNNVMHGRPADELRAAVLRHIESVLDDERLELSDVERETYARARNVVESVAV